MSHVSKPPLRRSRRWIELRATAVRDPRIPADRDDPDRPDPTAETDRPLTSCRARTIRAQPEDLPVSPVSAFSEMSALAARIAVAAIAESGRLVQDVTAYIGHPTRAERVHRRT